LKHPSAYDIISFIIFKQPRYGNSVVYSVSLINTKELKLFLLIIIINIINFNSINLLKCLTTSKMPITGRH
jgi:hypothetical protein